MCTCAHACTYCVCVEVSCYTAYVFSIISILFIYLPSKKKQTINYGAWAIMGGMGWLWCVCVCVCV